MGTVKIDANLSITGALSGVTTLGASGLATVGSLAAGTGGFSGLLSANAGLAVTGTSSVTGISTLTGGVTLGSAGTVTAGNRAVLGTSAGLQSNVPTGGTLIDSINGVTQATLSATGLTLAAGVINLSATSSPATSTTVNQIYGSSGGIGIGVPAGNGVYSQVNGLSLFVAGIANNAVGGASWGIGAYGFNATSYPSYPGIYSSAGSDMVFNVLATFNYKFNQGNAASSSITPYGFSGPGFYSTGTIYSTTGSNLSIICDAANTWSYNVPASGSHLFKINSVTQSTLNATGLTLAAGLTVTGDASVGGLINLPGTAGSTRTSTLAQIFSNAGNIGFNCPATKGVYLTVAGSSLMQVGAAATTVDAQAFGMGTYAPAASASGAGFYWTGSGNFMFNVPTSSTHQFNVNGANQVFITGAGIGINNGLYLTSGGMTISATSVMIGSDAAGVLTHNVPTSGSHLFKVNGVAQATLNTASLSLANALIVAGDTTVGGVLNLSGASGSAATSTLTQIYNTANNMVLNVPTTKGIYLTVAGTYILQMGAANSVVATKAWGIGALVNAGTASEAGIYWTGSGNLTSNVPTSSGYTWGVNGAVQATLNATGLTLVGKITAASAAISGTIGNTVAANPVQFAIPTPVAVATVTATAIPGLTTTFRGCIEVQGSDGSYGRFQLPQGSTTSTLVYGSATVSGGVPASTKWGIDYSAGWRFNNQTAGAITFTLIEVLTGIA